MEDEVETVELDSNKKLHGNIVSDINDILDQFTNNLKSKLNHKWIHLSDNSVYTGTTGILMYLRKRYQETGEKRLDELCTELLQVGLKHLDGRRNTFLCGDAGIIAMACLLDTDKSSDWLKKLMAMKQRDPSKFPNELLYGRAGYLYALLFVRKHCEWGEEKVSLDELITKVCQEIIKEGQQFSHHNNNGLPFFYTWHEKEYIGAAHGYVGILYTLLQAKQLVPACLTEKDMNTIKICMDKLLETQVFQSGNIRSSIGSHTDKLVHWCHGAPGAIHLYALGYKIYDQECYLVAAQRFADVIWERGLLHKGYGLCHGVSGNGYGLLCMYQATHKEEYLWKALKFAKWCFDYGNGCRAPDRPYSLFEGVSGTLYFLQDIVYPDTATFPGFQLAPYNSI